MTDKDVTDLLHLAAGVAAWVAGMSDEEAMVLLDQAQQTLRADMARRFGDDIAAVIAAAFPDAVISARRALEAAGATSRVAN